MKNIIQELTDLYNYKLNGDPANSKRKDKIDLKYRQSETQVYVVIMLFIF